MNKNIIKSLITSILMLSSLTAHSELTKQPLPKAKETPVLENKVSKEESSKTSENTSVANVDVADDENENEDEDQSEEVEASWSSINLNDATKAFKDFSSAIVKNKVVFYGVSSQDCLEHFRVSNSSSKDQNSVMIEYDGLDDTCLDASKSITKKSALVKLSERNDFKIPLRNLDGVVALKVIDPEKDKNNSSFEALVDDSSEELVYKSPSTIAKEKKEALAKKNEEIIAKKLEKVACVECNNKEEEIEKSRDLLSAISKKIKKADKEKLEKDLNDKQFALLNAKIATSTGNDLNLIEEKLKAFVATHPEYAVEASDSYVKLAAFKLQNKDRKLAYNSSINLLQEAAKTPGLEAAKEAELRSQIFNLSQQYLKESTLAGANSEAYKDASKLWKTKLYEEAVASGCTTNKPLNNDFSVCYQLSQKQKELTAVDQSAKQMEIAMLNRNNCYRFGFQNCSSLDQNIQTLSQKIMGVEPSVTTAEVKVGTQTPAAVPGQVVNGASDASGLSLPMNAWSMGSTLPASPAAANGLPAANSTQVFDAWNFGNGFNPYSS